MHSLSTLLLVMLNGVNKIMQIRWNTLMYDVDVVKNQENWGVRL